MVLIDAIVQKFTKREEWECACCSPRTSYSSRPKAGDKANTFTGQDKLLNTTAIVTNKTNRKMRRRKIVQVCISFSDGILRAITAYQHYK
jgi:hypothetical protein